MQVHVLNHFLPFSGICNIAYNFRHSNEQKMDAESRYHDMDIIAVCCGNDIRLVKHIRKSAAKWKLSPTRNERQCNEISNS